MTPKASTQAHPRPREATKDRTKGNYRRSVKPSVFNNGIGDWARNTFTPAREHSDTVECTATHNDRRLSPRGANLIASITHYVTSHQRRENASGAASCPDSPRPVAIGSHTETTGRLPIMIAHARAVGQRGYRAINIGPIIYEPKATRLTPVGWCQ